MTTKVNTNHHRNKQSKRLHFLTCSNCGSRELDRSYNLGLTLKVSSRRMTGKEHLKRQSDPSYNIKDDNDFYTQFDYYYCSVCGHLDQYNSALVEYRESYYVYRDLKKEEETRRILQKEYLANKIAESQLTQRLKEGPIASRYD